MPTTPRIARAVPMLGGGNASPPVKRGVERKTNHSALKVPKCIARRPFVVASSDLPFLPPKQILRRYLLTFKPQSFLPLNPSRVSSKPNTTPSALQNRNPALTTFGSAYGHFINHPTPFFPPRLPPVVHDLDEARHKKAKLTPILKVMGNNKNALDKNRFSRTISEIIVRMTPIFPFNTPNPGAYEADQDHAFPAAEKGVLGVGEATPEDGGAELGGCEGCGEETGLLGYDGVRGGLVFVGGPEAFELVVHVGLEAGLRRTRLRGWAWVGTLQMLMEMASVQICFRLCWADYKWFSRKM
ncbi:hypothetical protein KC340_g64 [Hortaea werneckii]|nr:hypothetical protein KC340_g64 [Hortaea werneckii]